MAESGGPATVGGVLRGAREARGETVADVAYALKLTVRQVEAMESNRFDLLPGPAFVRGFLRNYARHLGIDPAGLLAGFDQTLLAPPIELAPLSNADGVMPSGGRSRSAHVPAASVAGVLLFLVVVGWFFDWFEVPGGETSAVETTVAMPEILPVPEAADVLAPGEALTEHAPPAPAMPPLVASPGESSESAAAAGADGIADVPLSSQVSESPVPATVGTAAGAARLTFRFSGESWVEVRDAGGSIIYAGTNAAGTSRTVQGKAPFAVVIGNAREVALEHQGKAVDLTPHIRVSVARLTVQ